VAPDEALRRRREEIARLHIDSENRHAYDEALETFEHPRYEMYGDGEVFDGPEEVAEFYEEMRVGFPNRHDELLSLQHSDDAVITEFEASGTHLGSYRGLPPTGRTFSCRMLSLLEFEPESDRLVVERVYYDTATIQRQLGLAHDPLTLTGRVATVVNHPLTIGRGIVRRVIGR
jgi:steroid delta-isomerase-like uncharacterized protein